MFTKLLIICVVAAMAVATPVEYPEGLHPSVCPNYPHCDLETLLRHTPDGMPIPDWELHRPIYPIDHYARVAPFGHLPYADYTTYPYGRRIFV